MREMITMPKKKRKRRIGEPSGFLRFAGKKGKGRGRFYQVSKLIVGCMGVDDALLLSANYDFYETHRRNLWKEYTYYLSCSTCEILTGMDTKEQAKSYNRIYKIPLLIARPDIPGPRNALSRDINIPSGWIWSWLIYYHNKMTKKDMTWLEQLKVLRQFYKRAYRSQKRRSLFEQFTREMRQYSIEELDSGDYDEQLESFYDEYYNGKK